MNTIQITFLSGVPNYKTGRIYLIVLIENSEALKEKFLP